MVSSITVSCLVGFVVIASVAACSEPVGTRSGELSAEDSSQIAHEVLAQLEAFHKADTLMDAAAVVALLWPDYTMFADGQRLGYAEVSEGSHAFMSELELFHTVWTDVHLSVLGPRAAVTSFQFRDSIRTGAGELIQNRGTTTFVWQKRKEEWRILFADADHYPIENL